MKTSSEFLNVESQFRDDEHPDLLPEDPAYEIVRDLATPAERAILEAISKELALEGPERIEAAQRASQESPRRSRRGQGGNRSASRRADSLRDEIAGDLKKRWPELSNVLNPKAVEFLSTRSKMFIDAVEQHPKYKEYREQRDAAARTPDPAKRRVKFERFLSTADDVILRENLKRLADENRLAQYQALVAAEASSLRPHATTAATIPAPAPTTAK